MYSLLISEENLLPFDDCAVDRLYTEPEGPERVSRGPAFCWISKTSAALGENDNLQAQSTPPDEMVAHQGAGHTAVTYTELQLRPSMAPQNPREFISLEELDTDGGGGSSSNLHHHHHQEQQCHHYNHQNSIPDDVDVHQQQIYRSQLNQQQTNCYATATAHQP